MFPAFVIPFVGAAILSARGTVMALWQKRLEVAINVAILCAFLAVAALASKRFFEPSRVNSSGPKVGATLSLAGIEWQKSERSLVLALSIGCHFCSESAGFYQRLVPAASSCGVQVLAVLPQPVAESRNYLEKLGVTMPEVMAGSLATIGVSGTPTLLLLDRQGKILQAWVGKLDTDGERRVLSSLQP
jgi:hypothetical protein